MPQVRGLNSKPSALTAPQSTVTLALLFTLLSLNLMAAYLPI